MRVEGQPDSIHIEVRDVPLHEVLHALQVKFDLRFRSDDALDTPVTRNFNGSLRSVVARILDGYDYVMKISPQGIDVLVLRQNTQTNIATAQTRPARASPKALAAPVMTAQEATRYERGQAR